MDWPLVITVILVVLVGGSVVAVLWWKIAAGMAPYKDEVERAKGRSPNDRPQGKGAGGSGRDDEDVEVVVIRREGGTGAGEHNRAGT